MSASGLRAKAEDIIKIMSDNPYQTKPFLQKLVAI
jgi:hypothetical protein